MQNDTFSDSITRSLTMLADKIDPDGSVDKTALYKNAPDYIVEEAVERVAEHYNTPKEACVIDLPASVATFLTPQLTEFFTNIASEQGVNSFYFALSSNDEVDADAAEMFAQSNAALEAGIPCLLNMDDKLLPLGMQENGIASHGIVTFGGDSGVASMDLALMLQEGHLLVILAGFGVVLD